MKGKQTALMPGNDDKVGYWLTPEPMMSDLRREFRFTKDVAPWPRPAGYNGLKDSWEGRVWCNPPFISDRKYGEGISAWASKAIREHEAHPEGTIVLIAHTFRWMSRLVATGAEVRAPNGMQDVAWESPDGRVTPTPSPALLFILHPKDNGGGP